MAKFAPGMPWSSRTLAAERRAIKGFVLEKLPTWPACRSVSILDGEPVRVPLTFSETGIPFVYDMTNLMDQNVVQVIVSNCSRGPDQSPVVAVLNPPASKHLGFDPLSGARATDVQFLQRGFNWIEVDRRAPLQSVAREEPAFVRHSAELYDLESGLEIPRQPGDASVHVVGSDGMEISLARWIHDDAQQAVFARLVPLLRSIEMAASCQSIAPMLVR